MYTMFTFPCNVETFFHSVKNKIYKSTEKKRTKRVNPLLKARKTKQQEIKL